MQTRALLLNNPYNVSLIQKDLILKDDEVLVKNHLMGICGSDKTFYKGELPPTSNETRQKPGFPFYLGHESGGTVVDIGSKVREFKPGDFVMSFGWNNNFADYFKANVNEIEIAPEGLSHDLASLGEPISCAMFSGLNSGVQFGDTVAVFGAGFAGQIITQVVKRKGAYRVISIDVSDEKLKISKELGTDVTINIKEQNPIEIIRDLTDGKGADVVIESAGTQEAINMASKIIRHNGKFVFYSWVTRPVTLDISRWHDDGIEFINTCLVHHTYEERHIWVKEALRPVILGLVNIEPLITKEFKLENAADAFNYVTKNDSAIKVVLRP